MGLTVTHLLLCPCPLAWPTSHRCWCQGLSWWTACFLTFVWETAWHGSHAPSRCTSNKHHYNSLPAKSPIWTPTYSRKQPAIEHSLPLTSNNSSSFEIVPNGSNQACHKDLKIYSKASRFQKSHHNRRLSNQRLSQYFLFWLCKTFPHPGAQGEMEATADGFPCRKFVNEEPMLISSRS